MRIPVALAHTLPECGETNTLPVSSQREAITIAGCGVADLHQVAVVLKRGVAIVDLLVSVDILELQITGLPHRSATIIVGEPALRRRLGDVILTLEEPVNTEAPKLADLHTFIIMCGVVGRQRVGCSSVLGDIAAAVPQGGLSKIVQWTSGQRHLIAPTHAELPSVGLHVGIVALGRTVAIDGRQLVTDDIHVGGVFAIEVKAEVETIAEKVEVETKIIGSHLLPRQTVGYRRGGIGVGDELSVLDHTALFDRHRGEILIRTDESVTGLTNGCPDLKVVEPRIPQRSHPRLFAHPPANRPGREEAPLLA